MALLLPKKVKRGHIDKSQLAIGMVQRIECQAHIRWLHSLPCSVPNCRSTPIHAHHLTCSPEPKGRGVKAGDNWALPVCLNHHQGPYGIHTLGNERKFWASHGIDPVGLCRSFWAESGAEGIR